MKSNRTFFNGLTRIFLALVLVALTVLPAGAAISPPSLEVTLPAGGSVSEHKTVELPSLPPRADVVFAFDLTGSMGGILDTAKTSATDIMTALNLLGVDVRFGVMSYMDYPHFYDSYGYAATYGDATSGEPLPT